MFDWIEDFAMPLLRSALLALSSVMPMPYAHTLSTAANDGNRGLSYRTSFSSVHRFIYSLLLGLYQSFIGSYECKLFPVFVAIALRQPIAMDCRRAKYSTTRKAFFMLIYQFD
jgi:hypothetical protein